MCSALPAEMPARVSAHHAGLGMLRPGAGNVAAMPTKIGEFLAVGRPVVVSPGLGDLDDLLARYDCGVVVPDATTSGLHRAVDHLERLLDDPACPGRCRELAAQHFDLDSGIDALLEAYRDALLAGR
jgi:glycosyltransferase involved in cell wall biosynthesis